MPLTPEPKLAVVLEKLSALHPKKIDLSLGRMTRLLSALGNPERALPPVIHVAGTNGKGSVIAYLRAAFEAAGLKAHVYTSPHLVSFRERIRLAGNLIGEDRLIEILEHTERENTGRPITFFEITTAAAFVAFAEAPADILLLEVGLGGRLDATNVIDAPLVSVITPIGLDHAEFLGADLQGVAREKAGIMKRRVPVVSSKQTPEVRRVLIEEAESKGAILTFTDEDLKPPPLSLSGPHQLENARTAMAALSAQGRFSFSRAAIEKGLGNADWPARMQNLDPGKLGFKRDVTVILDGGHNPIAGEALAAAVKEKGLKNLTVILGMMAGKDVTGFLTPLAPFIETLIAIPIPGQDNCRAPGDLAGVGSGLGIECQKAENLQAALSLAVAKGTRRILITGSLYLAGEILKFAGIKPK